MWCRKGIEYRNINLERVGDNLPPFIYELNRDIDGFYLTKVADKFGFKGTLYNIDNGFIDYFVKTFNNTNGNIGTILAGFKGTGKTYTAKNICNQLGLPVIIVKYFEGVVNYLSTIDSDCVFFFDEYDKEFEEDTSVLSFMDGASNTNTRKVFLLTVNKMLINENLIGRPSRIRYVKRFNSLSIDIAKDILINNLSNGELLNPILELLKKVSFLTIDIVKSVAEELNIHNDINAIKDLLNITFNKYAISVLKCSPISISKTIKEVKEEFDASITSPDVIMSSTPTWDKIFNEESIIVSDDTYIETIDRYQCLTIYKILGISEVSYQF